MRGSTLIAGGALLAACLVGPARAADVPVATVAGRTITQAELDKHMKAKLVALEQEKYEAMREGFIRFLPVGVIVAAVMLLEMISLIGLKTLKAVPLPVNPAEAAGSNTAWLGQALFTKFLLPFEVAALILTVALIAAVALTLRKRTGVRTQKPGLQVLVQRDERLRVVKMASEAPKTGESA